MRTPVATTGHGGSSEESRNMPKISLATFLGFSDELQKIAAETQISTSSRGVGAVAKAAPTVSVSKPKLPKLVSKPQPAQEFTPSQDHIRSMKSHPPPPVTM